MPWSRRPRPTQPSQPVPPHLFDKAFGACPRLPSALGSAGCTLWTHFSALGLSLSASHFFRVDSTQPEETAKGVPRTLGYRPKIQNSVGLSKGNQAFDNPLAAFAPRVCLPQEFGQTSTAKHLEGLNHFIKTKQPRSTNTSEDFQPTPNKKSNKNAWSNHICPFCPLEIFHKKRHQT